MVTDKWTIPIEPARTLRRNVVALKNGTEAELKRLAEKIDSLQKKTDVLINAINTLIKILKEEVGSEKAVLKKRELPPPPPAPPKIEIPFTYERTKEV